MAVAMRHAAMPLSGRCAGQPLRMLSAFVLVGASGASGYVVLSSALHALGLALPLASALSYGLFVPVMYAAQRGLTFRSDAAHSTAFPRYAATQSLAFALSAALPAVAGDALAPLSVFSLVAVAIPLLNFTLLRLWAFSA